MDNPGPSDLVDPIDPVAAVTHVDPYPFYARLRAGPPLVWHEPLRVWVASRADVVQALLEMHDVLRVRPPAEPVPRAILGSPAGEIFGHLMRMNDGPAHAAHRPVLARALAGLDLHAAYDDALRTARATAAEAPLADALFDMPLRAAAQLLGFADAALPRVAAWMRAFVACLSPLSTPAQLEAASAAAGALMTRFEAIVHSVPGRESSLLAAVQREARDTGLAPSRAWLANLVGLLSQTCDATAGLIGNSLVALSREPLGPEPLRDVVEETARHDPSVQNTRRFVAAPTTFAGMSLAPGDAVLLVLAAANRDPSGHPDPDRFRVARAARGSLGFGHGVHRCPGEALACTLATAALAGMRDVRPEVFDAPQRLRWRYRPSVNARIPEFQ